MPETYKNKFNKKYGFSKDASHSISEISKLTGYKKSGLDTILDKGRGAFYSNPESVRPVVKDPTQWGMARIYSAVMGGKAAQVDASHLIKTK
jgi:thiamine biosynthesis protein ThiC